MFFYKVLLIIFALMAITSSVIAEPVIYIADSNGKLGTVDVKLGVVTIIGTMGQKMTDIAFDPSGNLYGITSTGLYSLNKVTGASVFIGSLGISDANALTFSTNGTLYAAGSNVSQLYTINIKTGATTPLGPIGNGIRSSGDLAFFGSSLFLTNDYNELATIDLQATYNSEVIGPLGFYNTFGLATGNDGVLYGAAGTLIFSIDTTTGKGDFLLNFAGKGLGATYGAAAETKQAAFLSFPLDCGDKDCAFHYSQGAYTPISINSVLDHQMDDPYKNEDGVVAAFTGERGEGPAVYQGCYPKIGGSPFSLLGLYKGTGDGCLADQGLNYDNHPGYDYRAGMGTPVKAAAGGKVVNILNTSTNKYGRCVPRGIPAGCDEWGYVGIDHGNGYVTQYGHLEMPITVEAGQMVVEGQQIGLSGDTGVPGRPHLHFEVLKQNKDKQYGYAFVDPYGWEGAPKIDYLAQINGIQNVRLWKDDPRECLFNWAERNYPQLFAPSGSPSLISSDSIYRYYAATKAYLRVSTIDNHVYYTDGDGKVQDVGLLSDWLPKAGCQTPPPKECLFNWAETNYPSLFAPSGFPTTAWDVYTYRYYSATNAYLGVSSADKHVYYMGADGILKDVGALSYWLPLASCQ